MNEKLNNLKENKKNLNIENSKEKEVMKERRYKIMFVGESAIGSKTSLIDRIIRDNFFENPLATTGLDFKIKEI